jgi:hypothetical protein
MKKVKDVKFSEELAQIKSLLPKYYMPLINHYYPERFSKSRVYNVMNAGIEDKDVLRALKRVANKNKTLQSI